MRSRLILGLAVVAAVGLSACDDAAKLAENMQGTWVGEPTSMMPAKPDKHHKGAPGQMVPDTEMTCSPTITFKLEQGTKGGTVNIDATYTVSQSVVTSIDTIAPIKATVSGTATVTGKWVAKDDDDIVLTLDPSKIDVSINPSTLKIDYAVLTDCPVSKLEGIEANVSANIEPQVKELFRQRLSQIRELEDIKFVNPSTVKMEIGKTKLLLNKK